MSVQHPLVGHAQTRPLFTQPPVPAADSPLDCEDQANPSTSVLPVPERENFKGSRDMCHWEPYMFIVYGARTGPHRLGEGRGS